RVGVAVVGPVTPSGRTIGANSRKRRPTHPFRFLPVFLLLVPNDYGSINLSGGMNTIGILLRRRNVTSYIKLFASWPGRGPFMSFVKSRRITGQNQFYMHMPS